MANLIKKAGQFISRIFQKAVSLPLRSAFSFLGGQIVTYDDCKLTYIKRGYEGNDIIYAIVNLIVNTAKLAPWSAYIVVDESAYKQMKAELTKGENADFALIRKLHKKSLELYTGDRQLNQILKYPNPNQTFSDLNGDLWTFKLVTGDYYEFWELPMGGLSKNIPLSLSALPSQYMEIRSSGTLPLVEEAYVLTLGQYIEFLREQVLHEKYTNLDWTAFGAQMYGMSPLRPARLRLQRNNEAKLSQASAFKNGGVRGIVSYDDSRLDPNDDKTWEQMGKIKETFEAETRPGSMGTGRTTFSQYGVKFTQIGLSPVDQGVNESELIDLRFFCAIYGVPSQLLNDTAAKTYNTTTEAEKALISRCAIPLLCSRRDSFNRKMNRNDNVIVDFDLSVYDALQPNKVQMAEWANKMPMTNRRKLEIMGEDVPETMTEDEANAILMPNNIVPLSELVMPPAEALSQAEIDAMNAAGDNPYQQAE